MTKGEHMLVGIQVNNTCHQTSKNLSSSKNQNINAVNQFHNRNQNFQETIEIEIENLMRVSFARESSKTAVALFHFFR